MSGPESSVYVILGATGGIGQPLCKRLHARGARLILGGRREDALKTLSASVGDAPYRVVDVRKSEEVDATVALATEHYGRLDGLANLVGSLMLKPAHLLSNADWDDTLALNLNSSFYALRAAVGAIGREHGGAIVLMSSAVALYGLPNHEAIAAAKGGIVSLVKSAASTYARYKIRVNAVAPGLTETPLTKRLTSQPAIAEASKQMHALGRFGRADEVAAAVEFLLVPENSFITGQVLAVDGGLSSIRPFGATATSQRS